MQVLMLGGDHQYSTGLGATSLTLSSADIGTRDIAEMQVRVQYYLDNGQTQANAIAYAKRDYDKDSAAKQAAGSATSKGTTVIDSLNTLLKQNPGLSNLADPNAWAKLVAAAKGQGYTDADINAMRTASQHSGFNLQSSMPWLVVGGVALVALLLMFGTRGRK